MSEHTGKGLVRRRFLKGLAVAAGLGAITPILQACGPAAPAAEPTKPAAAQPPAAQPTQAPAAQPTQAPAAQPTQAPAAKPAASGGKTTLRVQSWDTGMVKGTAWWDDIVKAFEDKNSGFTVEANFIAFAQYLPTLEAQVAGNDMPDLFWHGVKAQELGDANKIINWNDFMDKAVLDDFFVGPLRQARFHGNKQYGLPMNAQLFAMYVNNKMLKDAGVTYPETWDDLIASVPKFQAKTTIPLAFGNSAKNVAADFFLPLIAQYGGNVYDMDAGEPKDWDTDATLKALQLVQKLAKAKVFPDGINGISEEQGWQLAFQGKAAILYTSNSAGRYVTEKVSQDYKDNLTIEKVPAAAKGGAHSTGDGSGRGTAAATGSKIRDTAVGFMKHFFSVGVYSKFVVGANDTSAVKSAAKDVVNPYSKKMMEWMDDGVDHILFGAGYWDAICNVLQGIIDGSVEPRAGLDRIVADSTAARKK